VIMWHLSTRQSIGCTSTFYVPHLQTVGAMLGYLRVHRGQRFASTTAVAPMTEAFVRNIEQFVAAEGVDLIAFEKGQRKDDVTQKYLREFRKSEGVLYVGNRIGSHLTRCRQCELAARQIHSCGRSCPHHLV
jgi:hypothetical protein